MMLCRALICLGAVGAAIIVDSKEVRSLIDVEGREQGMFVGWRM